MRRSITKSRVIGVYFFLVSWLPTMGQVSNDNIKSRSELFLNANPIHSSTNNASVEWNCVNKALTNKCLVYHNDQWFHFTPNQSGEFFLNVSLQTCTYLQGIQAIVIEGNPCEISTYKILQCIPRIHQNDVFIQLDSLRAGVQYLVNIDGFLGDFCEFDIQFSTRPVGLPRTMHSLDTIHMEVALKGGGVTIRWSVQESIAKEINLFKIYRQAQGEQRSLWIRDVPLSANALGNFDQNYFLEDSLLKKNNYTYRIFGVQHETEYPLLLSEQNLFFNPASDKAVWVSIPLDLEDKRPYMVLVFNKTDQTLLRKYGGEFDRKNDATFEMNLQEFVNSGVKEFTILASVLDSNHPKEYYFLYDGAKMVEK